LSNGAAAAAAAAAASSSKQQQAAASSKQQQQQLRFPLAGDHLAAVITDKYFTARIKSTIGL
jgi:hypothetical protein